MSKQIKITEAPWSKLASNLAIVLAVTAVLSLSLRQHVMASIPELTLEQVEMFTDMVEEDGEYAPVYEIK